MKIAKFVRLAGVCVLSASLSGCIVAAVPLVMAAGAVAAGATGFFVYKSVQTKSGGTVRVAYGSRDDKTAQPPAPLPQGRVVAVWGSGERETRFEQTLRNDGRFDVRRAPGGPPPADASARAAAYGQVCDDTHADLVFAAVDEGETVSSNALSFKRGTSTRKYALEGYACGQRATGWSDTMAVIVESGSKAASQSEIDDIAGQAWAERVEAARGVAGK